MAAANSDKPNTSFRLRSMCLNPRELPRNLDLPLSLKVNLRPTPNLPLPLKLALLLASLPIHKLLPPNKQSIILKVDRLSIFGICEPKWLAQDDLGAFVLACRDHIAHNKVGNSELVLVVDRYLSGVGSSIKDLRKGASIRFDDFGGTGVSDLGGGVVTESTFEVVASVDVLKYTKTPLKILLRVIWEGTYVD